MKDLVKLLEEHEGRGREVYPDSKGLPTIGIGHLLTRSELASGKIYIDEIPVKYYNGLTDKQIDDLCVQDCRIAIKAINLYVKVSLNRNQSQALISFVFNIGTEAFRNSTLLKKLNQGLHKEVPEEMRRWIYEGKKESRGLKLRREREISLWLKPVG